MFRFDGMSVSPQSVSMRSWRRGRTGPLSLLAAALALVLGSCSPASERAAAAASEAAAASGVRSQSARLAAAPGWSTVASLASARSGHTTTLLPTGKVLVVGGTGSSAILASAELYDQATGTWAATGPLALARRNHTATLLPSGQVLVVGGEGPGGTLTTAELYDPATGTWAATSALVEARGSHTATLLPSGQVLVVGGTGANGSLASAELYEPTTGTWATTGALAQARSGATATLLSSGWVLVAGGTDATGALASTELYDPFTGTWAATGALAQARSGATATLLPSGKVLVAGGAGPSGALTSVELYDAATGTWTATLSLHQGRSGATATLLSSGKVLVAGGLNGNAPLSSAGLFNPATGTWTPLTSLAQARRDHTAVLLPSGQVLVVGGVGPSGPLASTELYHPASESWTAAAPLPQGRQDYGATLLPSGKVLVAGGFTNGGALAPALLYDSATGSWSTTGSLAQVRSDLTVTLLPSGKVLAAGGYGSGNALTSAEVYDPATGLWTATGSLSQARYHHTATLLPSGKVLVVGGRNQSYYGDLASAELYDPATGSWSTTGSLSHSLFGHTATLLPSGKVLVAGGATGSGSYGYASAELYDPATGTWTATSPMARARSEHTATLLPSGKVLVVGGYGSPTFMPSVELYDPATGTWTGAAPLNHGRYYHVATLLPSGKVLVASGAEDAQSTTTELYDPAAGTWTELASPAVRRFDYTATLLPSGQVLMTGGYGTIASAELYDGTGAAPAWRPAISSVTAGAPLAPGGVFTVNGSRLRGISEASGGGSRSAPTDFPLLTLLDLGRGTLAVLPAQDFSSVHVTARVPLVPPGQYLLSVTVNGLTASTVLGIIAAPDTQSPTAMLTAPAAGATLKGTVTLSAAASDNVGVTRVEFYAGDTLLGTDTAAPFSLSWNTMTVANGAHLLSVKAYDALELSGTSPGVSVTVDNDRIAPTVTFSAPTAGATVTGTFTLTATATDNLGVTRVEFYEGSTLVGSDSSSPYTSSWNTRNGSNGSRTLTAKAHDAAGNIGTTTLTVTADNDFTPPTVTLTAPAEGATVSGTATFTATTSDTSGISKVVFFVGTSQVGTATTAPYSVSYNTRNMPNGAKVLTAKAYDPLNNVSTSAPVNVTFDNDFTLPTATITAPGEGSTLTGTIILTATASDAAGISSVAFFVGGLHVGTVNSAPYSLSYNTRNLSNGAKVLTAKAYDAFGNVGTSAGVNVTFDNDLTPPTVTLAAPGEGSTLTGTVVLAATASDAAGISSVAFFVGSTQVGTATSAPYAVSYNTRSLPNGAKAFTAKAYDTLGNVGTSAPVNVTFDNDLTPPTAKLTSPGAGVVLKGTVTLTATASDNLGVTRVEFYDGATLLGTDSTAPYSLSWDTKTAANGARQLSVKAYDALEQPGTSPGVSVTVDNDRIAPTVAFSAPAAGATVMGTVTVTATATDNATIARVEFYEAGTLLGSDTASPYAASWNTRNGSNGSRTLTAQAYDATGNSSTTEVTVTVDNDFTPPTVTLTAPAEGSIVSGTVALTATASDDRAMAKVVFFVGTTQVGTDTTAPYSFSYSTRSMPNGDKVLTAKAYDAANNVATSAPVNVNFDNDFTPPTVTLTAPGEGDTLTGTAVFTATASDDRAVTRVAFFVGTTQVGSDTTVPYSFSYNTRNTTNGAKVITAKAYDAVNNVGTSAGVNVTFDNDFTLPTVMLTAPDGGDTLTGTVVLTATASDEAGISKVVFYAGSTQLGTSTSAPYAFSYNTRNLSNGAKALTAKAYDTLGNVGTSTPVNVTFDNDFTAPATTITTPTSGSTLYGVVQIDATASDDRSPITKVDFYQGSLLLGTVTTAPYTWSWDTSKVAVGNYTLKTRAWDGAGNSAYSTAVTVSVTRY